MFSKSVEPGQKKTNKQEKKKKKKKQFCIPLPDRPIENDPDPKYFFIETNGLFSFTKIYILQLEEFSVLFCYF